MKQSHLPATVNKSGDLRRQRAPICWVERHVEYCFAIFREIDVGLAIAKTTDVVKGKDASNLAGSSCLLIADCILPRAHLL